MSFLRPPRIAAGRGARATTSESGSREKRLASEQLGTLRAREECACCRPARRRRVGGFNGVGERPAGTAEGPSMMRDQARSRAGERLARRVPSGSITATSWTGLREAALRLSAARRESVALAAPPASAGHARREQQGGERLVGVVAADGCRHRSPSLENTALHLRMERRRCRRRSRRRRRASFDGRARTQRRRRRLVHGRSTRAQPAAGVLVDGVECC